VDVCAGFCQRFQRDFEDLRTFFGWEIDRPEGAVEGLRTDLSDRHSGGQTVSECVLRTGERVVYKPRTVEPEAAFYRFIHWLNGQGLSLDLRELRALGRTTHGWVESVAPAPCGSLPEVEKFYRRAGMLLGALHVTGTTDIHRENLIACGEHPVVVDLETMLSDVARDLSSSHGKMEGTASGGVSVLSTGLLPRWQTAADGHPFDVSGLGGDEAQDQGVRHVWWRSINTDQMALSQDERFPVSTAHRVRLNDQIPSAASYLPALLAGFEEVYSLMVSQRERLLCDEEFMSSFDNLELRVLVRNTTTYTRLQLHLLHPEFLKDGLDRSIELEWLARPLSGPLLSLPRQQIYDIERRSMESLDVPHFVSSLWKGTESSPESDLLFLWGDRDSRVFRRRLAGLSPEDCSEQLATIREAVQSRFGAERKDHDSSS
jgi:type 2 lantibiotic biosynthesis protein LanM